MTARASRTQPQPRSPAPTARELAAARAIARMVFEDQRRAAEARRG